MNRILRRHPFPRPRDLARAGLFLLMPALRMRRRRWRARRPIRQSPGSRRRDCDPGGALRRPGDSEGAGFRRAAGAGGAALRPAPEVVRGRVYDLPELIDIAQSRNPLTKIAWEQARRAAVARGMVEGSLSAADLGQRGRRLPAFLPVAAGADRLGGRCGRTLSGISPQIAGMAAVRFRPARRPARRQSRTSLPPISCSTARIRRSSSMSRAPIMSTMPPSAASRSPGGRLANSNRILDAATERSEKGSAPRWKSPRRASRWRGQSSPWTGANATPIRRFWAPWGFRPPPS